MASLIATKGREMSERDQTLPSRVRCCWTSAPELWCCSLSHEDVRAVEGAEGDGVVGTAKSVWEYISSSSTSSALISVVVRGVVGEAVLMGGRRVVPPGGV